MLVGDEFVIFFRPDQSGSDFLGFCNQILERFGQSQRLLERERVFEVSNRSSRLGSPRLTMNSSIASRASPTTITPPQIFRISIGTGEISAIKSFPS